MCLRWLMFSEKMDKTVKIEASTVDIEERGVKLRLTVVDTPGFGDAMNCHAWFVTSYLTATITAAAIMIAVIVIQQHISASLTSEALLCYCQKYFRHEWINCTATY